MPQLFTNNAWSFLNGGINNVTTSIALTAGTGARFPNPTGGDFFLLTLIGLDGNAVENSWEIVKVTARVTDTLTVVRAQEGTTAVAWASGTRVELRLTAAQATGFEAKLATAAIGTTVQAYDATLTSLSALGTAAGKMAYTTGADTWAEASITAAGRALLDDASAAAQLTTLGTTAFNTFVSADQTITLAGALTLAHGLGVAPRFWSVAYVCQTAELGYSIGDIVDGSSDAEPGIQPDATNLNVRYRSSAPSLVNKTNGALNTITPANWKARFFAIK